MSWIVTDPKETKEASQITVWHCDRRAVLFSGKAESLNSKTVDWIYVCLICKTQITIKCRPLEKEETEK